MKKNKASTSSNHAGNASSVGSDRIFKMIKILVILLLLFTAYKFLLQYMRYNEALSLSKEYSLALETAETGYALKTEEKTLLFDDKYIERFARQHLGMIKKGEKLIYPAKKADMPTLDTNSNPEDYTH